MKKTVKTPVMSIVQDDADVQTMTVQEEGTLQELPQTTITDTPQYEGPVKKMVTKKYEAVPPLQIGVNPSVAGIVSQLEDKNKELAMQIRENNHAIAILKIAEVIRNGHSIYTTAEFVANNMIIEVPQPPKPVE